MCGCEAHWAKDVRCTCICPEHEHIRKHYAELDEWDLTHSEEYKDLAIRLWMRWHETDQALYDVKGSGRYVRDNQMERDRIVLGIDDPIPGYVHPYDLKEGNDVAADGGTSSKD